MRKIAPLFQLDRALIQLKHIHASQTKTWSKAPRQAPLASAAVHLINNPQRPWTHEEDILTIRVLHTQSWMQGTWVGMRRCIAGLTIASTPAQPKASVAWSRPTVSLIARERTEHDEECKSISIVEEPLSQVVRKLHGTRPRSRRWAQIW